MRNRVVVFAAVVVLIGCARATFASPIFYFSFTNTLGNTPGSVSGEIFGLPDTGSSAATSILINQITNPLLAAPFPSTPFDAAPYFCGVVVCQNHFTTLNDTLVSGSYDGVKVVPGGSVEFDLISSTGLGYLFQAGPYNTVGPLVLTEAASLTLGGGSVANPVVLSGGAIGQILGSIGGYGTQDFYEFYWPGGPFSAAASIGTANANASYAYDLYGGANLIAAQTLNAADNWAETMALASLAAGNYEIGIDANNSADPTFAINFAAPVDGVATPEPATLTLTTLGLVGLVTRYRRHRSRSES